ncbi:MULTISPECIES: bifunctional DNA primase/polymerase [Actinomadura]|uniref:Bifunctional DNA primase/polymerase n=1 Tax=Actinomadura yumaensis TaxID=111807 RepID=A0ABW2CU44_9ACTN|nr:bifunctional DNA primase/polymerase [Actinomadura sp. J1-007]
MTDRTCEHCGEGLALLARADARYCSTRCRMAAHRARRHQVPAELRTARRWVRRSASKVPLTCAGEAASSTDPGTWDSYDAVRRSTAGAGIGCVLRPDDDVVCIDLDHALDADGAPLPWAAAILARIPRTWVEVSPSGDGLHIWGRADVAGGRKLPRPGGGVEVYGSGRYITVTGRPYGRAVAQFGDLTEVIGFLLPSPSSRLPLQGV